MTTLPIKSNNETYSLLCGEEHKDTYTGTINGNACTIIARRVGRIVYLKITWAGTASSSTRYDVCTIDEKYRPMEDANIIVGNFVGSTWYANAITRFIIGTNGIVSLMTSEGSHTAKEASITYIVD